MLKRTGPEEGMLLVPSAVVRVLLSTDELRTGQRPGVVQRRVQTNTLTLTHAEDA